MADDLTGRDWTELYFDDAAEGYLSVLRENLPEFSETDPGDPLIQDAYRTGLLAHRDTGMIDLAASEAAWPTMQRRSGAISMSALVGQRLLADRPAAVDVLLDLVGTPGPSDIILPEETLFSSLGDVDTEIVRFESTAGDVATGNLEFTVVARSGGVFGTPAVGTVASPWGASPAAGDAIYIGHPVLTWDAMQLEGAGSPDDYTTSLEYYDGRFRQRFADASSVSVDGVEITMGVDGLLFATGITPRDSSGLTVRVTCVETGQYEEVSVAWSGSASTITTLTALGQSSPSSDPQAYLLAAQWLPYPADNFEPDGLAFDRLVEAVALPDESEGTQPVYGEPWRKWQSSSIAGVTRYWLRERVVALGGAPAAPTSVTATPADDIVWTLPVTAIQGESVQDVVGTSTGDAFQAFRLATSDYVEGSFEYVAVADDTEWELVADGLYSSGPEDKHFTLTEEPDGSLRIPFGNGTNGFIPPRGSLITAFYRRNAAGNGNIGALAIDSIDGGTGFLGAIRNPRPGAGWQVREADDKAGLTRVKRIIPSAVRANSRMVTQDDIEAVVRREFFTADGRQPYSRVVPVEQGAGLKTTLLVAVPAGEILYGSDSDLDELAEFCNGSRTGLQRFGGRALSNQEVVPVHWSPAIFTAVITLKIVKRYAPFAEDIVRPVLVAALSPTSTTESGAWRWWTGNEITEGAITAIIGSASTVGLEGLVDVEVDFTPALPFLLSKAQLPLLDPADGSLQINVVEVS